jgi:hypothetical protein
MNELVDSTKPTMTLKEITDLLEVRHNNAMLTVEKMAATPEFGELLKISSSYINNIGAALPLETYALDKRQSIAVSAQLNTALLMRVIDRWQELEANQTPKTYAAALRKLADSVEALELAEANLQVAEAEVQILKVALRAANIEVTGHQDKIFDANYEKGVNTYHKRAWQTVYPELDYPA